MVCGSDDIWERDAGRMKALCHSVRCCVVVLFDVVLYERKLCCVEIKGWEVDVS